VTPAAASSYAAAGAACCAGDRDLVIRHLREAVAGGSIVAGADLAVLQGRGLGKAAPSAAGTGSSPIGRWERHHLEILRALDARDRVWALALLRDHTAEFGCDPVLVLLVHDRGCGELVLPSCPCRASH